MSETATVDINSGIRPESYGAVADGSTDCTTALQAAINAALQARCPVLLSKGTYKITSTLNCSAAVASVPEANTVGVQILGMGRKDSRIKLVKDNATDALVFGNGTEYCRYGLLKDLMVTGPDGLSRDLISLSACSETRLDNVEARDAGRHCFISTAHQYLDCRNCHFQISGSDCAVIGTAADAGTVGTTAVFYHCQFDSATGVGFKVRYRAWDVLCDCCVFQSNSSYGIETLDGSLTLINPYFEDNADHHAIFGTSGSTTLGACAIVISPTCNFGLSMAPGDGAIYFMRCNASACIGGSWSTSITKPIRVDTEADVTILAYNAAAAGPPVHTTGAVDSDIKKSYVGSTGVTRRFFESKTWNPGLIAAGAQASTTVTIPFQGADGEESQYPQLGDIVNVGFDTTNPGLLLSAYVSTPCSGVDVPPWTTTEAVVTVTIHNATAGGVTPASSTLKVEVIKP